MIDKTANEQELQDTLVDIATAEVKTEAKPISELSMDQLVGQLLLKLVDLNNRVEALADIHTYVDSKCDQMYEKSIDYTDNECDTVKHSYIDEVVADTARETAVDFLEEEFVNRFDEQLRKNSFKLSRL
jgi:hypothetical protein